MDAQEFDKALEELKHYIRGIFKMGELETIKFTSMDKFQEAMKKLVEGQEAFRSYEDKDGKTQRKLIIKNHKIYLGNGYSIKVNQDNNGNVFLSVDYFGVRDRINVAKSKQTEFVDATEV